MPFAWKRVCSRVLARRGTFDPKGCAIRRSLCRRGGNENGVYLFRIRLKTKNSRCKGREKTIADVFASLSISSWSASSSLLNFFSSAIFLPTLLPSDRETSFKARTPQNYRNLQRVNRNEKPGWWYFKTVYSWEVAFDIAWQNREDKYNASAFWE